MTTEEKTLEEIAAQFGRFSPPPDFRHPAELEARPPRPIPSSVRSGPFLRSRRVTAATAVQGGLVLLAASQFEFAKNVGHYVLPLAYLDWIGWGVIAIGVGMWIFQKVNLGGLRYLRDGEPVIGRVLSVGEWRTQVGDMTMMGLAVGLEYPDPKTGEPRFAEARTDHLGISGTNRWSLRAKPGDYITCVYLPGTPFLNVKPYGFLRATYASDLLMKDGKPATASSAMAESWMLVAVLSLIVAGLFYALHAVQFWSPLTENHWVYVGGVGVAGILCALVALPLVWLDAVKKGQPPLMHALKYAGLCGLLGALPGGIFGVMGVNVLLDSAPASRQEIAIEHYWQETTNGVFRQYQIEYRDVPGSGTRKRNVPYDQLSEFAATGVAVMEVAPGYLGMPWVRHVRPVRCVPVPDFVADDPVFVVDMMNQELAAEKGIEPVPPPAPEAIVRRASTVTVESETTVGPSTAGPPEEAGDPGNPGAKAAKAPVQQSGSDDEDGRGMVELAIDPNSDNPPRVLHYLAEYDDHYELVSPALAKIAWDNMRRKDYFGPLDPQVARRLQRVDE